MAQFERRRVLLGAAASALAPILPAAAEWGSRDAYYGPAIPIRRLSPAEAKALSFGFVCPDLECPFCRNVGDPPRALLEYKEREARRKATLANTMVLTASDNPAPSSRGLTS